MKHLLGKILFFLFVSAEFTWADPVPIVAAYSMAPDPSQPLKLVDRSGTNSDGALQGGASFVSDPSQGPVLKLDGVNGIAEVKQRPLIDRLGRELSITTWIKLEALPAEHHVAAIFAKRAGGASPFNLTEMDQGGLHFEGVTGESWTAINSPPHTIEPGKWQHIAATYKTGAEMTIYVDGKKVAQGKAPFPLQPNEQAFYLGADGGSYFKGFIGAVHIYARALSAEEIAQDKDGILAARPATLADIPEVQYHVGITLGRFDMPRVPRMTYGPICQTAQRRGAPDAIDWPQFTLDGAPLFQKGDSADDNVYMRKRTGAESMSKFEQEGDPLIEPGHHWFRPLAWRWGQSFVYTDDRYARSYSGVYELWVFPVLIEGAGEQAVRNIELKYRGQTIYHQDGPFHSLTLLLPANAPGEPYSLTVAGHNAASFDVGLLPVELGHPKDVVIPINLVLPGSGPKITVKNLTRPDAFPQQADWDKDVAALAAYVPAHFEPAPKADSMQSRMGLTVPRSPVTVNAISLIAGMSGGFFFNGADGHGATHAFAGTPDDYAHYLADIGYDRVFEFTSLLGASSTLSPSDPRSLDTVAAALSRSGVQLGLVPGDGWARPSLEHPNIPIFAWTLPDFCQPLYRSIQVQTQRYDRYGNFAGTCIGADNAGYVSYWNWAPPNPDRPWPEAMKAFFQGKPVQIPVASTAGGLEAKEYRASSVREVVDYIAKYDETFSSLGYFDKGLKEVDPAALATCGMFGSSPGVGRGGWPWASIPGRPLFKDLDVQQAYDWNECISSKPLHNVALLDRLRSYDPRKTTWSLIDDFVLLLDRGLRQRAYAMALTRGVQAIGTTFLANPTGDRARPDVLADQKELYAWIHRYGGAYAMSEPQAAIGILYVHPQSLLRGIVGGDNPDEEALLHGSHEGKTTEALFLCHAAGWPTRIITPEELKRGLNPGMKTILLVGLNQFDSSWTWSDGLKDQLEKFVESGGRILLDDESACPVPATSTGMKVHAYINQRSLDGTPELLARNEENITKLREAMKGVPAPVAVSSDPTVWAVPTQAGDTQYVTVVNQLMQSEPFPKFADGHRVMKGQTGTLVWNTTRPIYDVRLGRRITPEQASKVDLTHDAFQWYALPPEEVSKPKIVVSDGADGYKQAIVTISGKSSMKGIPVEITLKRPEETVTLFTATVLPTRLPVRSEDAFGNCEVTAKELLSGLSTQTTLKTNGAAVANSPSADVCVFRAADMKLFGSRRQEPLTIALTDRQAANPEMKQLADVVAAHYRALGRSVELGRAEPNQLILSRQPYRMTQPYPQWKTVESDLVLFGSPNDNVLVMDQDRGYLLPPGIDGLKAGQGIACLTFSPFVGECQVVNFIAPDVKGLKASVDALIKADHAGG